MKKGGVPFEEIAIRLRQPDSKVAILAHSPAGKVPALRDGDLLVWDSLAIIEYIADRHPEARLWPQDPSARAIARSASAEMHSGFQALREHCPMDFLARLPRDSFIDPVVLNITRIVELWRSCREQYGARGPYLFSEFTAADAMYAPVASRFRTYVPDLAAFGDDGTAAAYVEALLSLPEMKEWAEAARREEAA